MINLSQSEYNRFDYAHQEDPNPETIEILKSVPSRWGRMPALARLLVVETGRILRSHGYLDSGNHLGESGLIVGLIGGTSRGSLTTDLAFGDSLKAGVDLASPALFGYTLANIPLAEAANHYNLTGPVYALIDQERPLKSSQAECKRILAHSRDIHFMLACGFDEIGTKNSDNHLKITITLVQRP